MLKALAKSVLVPLRLTAAGSATYAAIQKEMFGSGTRPSDLAKFLAAGLFEYVWAFSGHQALKSLQKYAD